MAGGSTDAAAVLVGMNRLFGLGLGKKELMRRGVKLGADIPYCILRGTALSEGIGEILTELPPAPQCHVVLAKPQISVSTKAVYEKLRVDALGPEAHPDIDGMAAAIRAGSLDGVTAVWGMCWKRSRSRIIRRSAPLSGSCWSTGRRGRS